MLHFRRLVGVGTLPPSFGSFASLELGTRGLDLNEFSRELANEGRRASYSGRGEGNEMDEAVVAVEAERGAAPVLPDVVGRYVSQSFGRGGTGGIPRTTSPSPPPPALSFRSSPPGRTSVPLCTDEMSLPPLERRAFDAPDRLAKLVPDVES